MVPNWRCGWVGCWHPLSETSCVLLMIKILLLPKLFLALTREEGENFEDLWGAHGSPSRSLYTTVSRAFHY